jgi:ribosomal protein L16 Arg81 hydroxylase
VPRKSPRPHSAPFLLDRNFWSSFSKNHWEKKPLLLRNVKSGLSEMGESEIFNLLVLYSDRCRKLNNPEGFKLYIDGFKAEAEEVLQILPEKKDKSLLGYQTRMGALFSDYCLVCDELLTVNFKKQHVLTDFTNELYRNVGFPNRFSEIGLYLGNYRKTPFGVHVDSCSVFSFPVVGIKKFRLWTAAFGKKNPGLDRTFNYDKYKKDSQVMEVGPGDMTYWPSSAWHIAESDGSFTATWSLGVWVDKHHQELFSDTLQILLNKKLGTAGNASMTAFKTLHSKAGEITELPRSYRNSIQHLQSLKPAELEETFLKFWMQHISLQGFKTIPYIDFNLSLKSRIQLRNKNALILWQQGLAEKGKFFLSFGGELIETSKSSGLLKLIQSVNLGENCLVSDFIKGAALKKELASLRVFARAGAFSEG